MLSIPPERVAFPVFQLHLKHVSLQFEAKNLIHLKRKTLDKAFDVLTVCNPSRRAVTTENWMAIMNIIQPKMSKARLNLLYHVLDDNRDNFIGNNLIF